MMEENNIIPLVPMQVPFSEEEKQEVELFAGIGYTIQKIAILLEEDYQKLMIDENSYNFGAPACRRKIISILAPFMSKINSL